LKTNSLATTIMVLTWNPIQNPMGHLHIPTMGTKL
jgi:hypothetical protein